MQCTIRSYGPTADGITPDTAIFQHAIDEIAAQGGGTLVVEAGRYLLGGLMLPSNFCLQLDAGAELIASANYHDFAQATTLSQAELSDRAFLYARGQRNITLCGTGKIIGNANAYFCAEPDAQGYRLPAQHRPRIIVLEGCEQLCLQDITLEHAPMWTVHLVSCRHVNIERLTVDNDMTMANTDGLNIDSCQDVRISHCHLSAADDALCIKTTAKPATIQYPVQRITISHCTLRSRSCALKIGTETFADIEDVQVSHCTVYDSNRAIGLLSRDGGVFRRLRFSDITFECVAAPPCHWGKADPVCISVRHRDPAITPGVIDDVQFIRLSGISEGAINLHSTPAGYVRHVHFDQLTLEQRDSGSPEQGVYDIRPPCNPQRPTGMGLDNAYLVNPETGRAYGVETYPDGLPALFAQGVSGLTLHNITIRRPQPLPAGWNPEAIIERG
ncbi:glycoside hydrolase family 28 protein [Dickeya lacustris]|uniref:Glycosyl hydrolase family 28 protein n=1 Tax=Dickeya lacustris TaxID=2259638 RepID=A0ABY8G546_9GAMM|nr:glycosyl hydrolase family 28 protein [Dickeya lacustris]WFN55058.1 glycosyl hydrolase family 28 protein [Dickeya lacustris]